MNMECLTSYKNWMRSLKLDKNLRRKIEIEITNIEKLLETAKDTLSYCRNNELFDFEKTSATALTFHSFYNGVENILIIITKGFNESFPKGNDWHMELFNRAFIVNEKYGKIFDEDIKPKLKEYLTFRHFLRHTYGFLLDPIKLKPLLMNIDNVWTAIKNNLIQFVGKFYQ